MSQYAKFLDQVSKLYEQGYSKSEAARIIRDEHFSDKKVDTVREGLRAALKKEKAIHPALEEEAQRIGIPVEQVSSYWHKGKHFSINVRHSAVEDKLRELKNTLIHDLLEYSPSFPKVEYTSTQDSHCLVVDPADVHIGKLSSSFETGESYDSAIAVDLVSRGVDRLLEMSTGFKVDQIVFIAGNDILHTDTPRSTTTKGTPQDTSGTWYDNFNIAKNLYVRVVEKLLSYAPVHFVFNPSNHDYMSGYFLCDVVDVYFRNHPGFTSDITMANRKYFRYHSSLIGTTHGDGAKPFDLPLLMATESPEWSETKHRYIYTHHVHHKAARDYPGVTVESVRSPSAADSWHHRHGYQHAVRAIEAYVHSKDRGQVARFTCNF